LDAGKISFTEQSGTPAIWPFSLIDARRAALKIGLICVMLSLLCWTASVPLHCVEIAALVGGFSYLNGTFFGIMLALVTRSRRPVLIYLWLGLAALSFYPLFIAWPPADELSIEAWRGAPPIVYNYFDALRPLLFLLGMPPPFIAFGFHAPDPAPTEVK